MMTSAKSVGFKTASALLLGVGIAATSAAMHGQAVGARYVTGITTIAGSGTKGFAGDNGPATAAQLNTPQGATYDASGNLYIADTGNNRIRRVDAITGVITTVAGTGLAAPYDGGNNTPAATANLSGPVAIAFDAAGNYYIADYGNCVVRRVAIATNTISTVIGSGTCGTVSAPTSPSGNFQHIEGVAVDSAGNLDFVDNPQNRVFRYTPSTNSVAPYIGGGTDGKQITGDGQGATSIKVGLPGMFSLDAAGNVFLPDMYNDVVREVTVSNNKINTVAGTYDGTAAATTPSVPVPGNTGDGGPGTAATLLTPTATFADPYANVYIADTGNNRIRVVNLSTGILNGYAGSAAAVAGFGGDLGPAQSATLSGPTGLGGDAGGDKLAIADTGNNRIRLATLGNVFPAVAVGSNSIAQTIVAQAGTTGTVSSFGTSAAATDFTSGVAIGCPGALGANASCSLLATFAPKAPGIRYGRVVITDSTGVSSNLSVVGIGSGPAANFVPGNLSAIAGTGTAGFADSTSGTTALLNQPGSVAVDFAGNTYVADTANNRIRLITAATGAVTTVAGNGTAGFSADGVAATTSQLNGPLGVTVDGSGNIYIADTGNNRVRFVSGSTGLITTLAGGATAGSTGDGAAATAALLNAPQDVALDVFGNLYIADTGNNKVREVFASTGIIGTFAGTGTAGTSADGTAAVAAMLSAPRAVALDAHGDVFIADTGNSLLREVLVPGGTIVTVAGTSGTPGGTGDGGSAKSATLNLPGHLAVDPAGDIYVADTGNNEVREVSAASGLIATVAGTGKAGVSVDALLATNSALLGARGITTDSLGNLYIADSGNNRVVRSTASTATVPFATQARGTVSATQTVGVQNFGNLPLTLTGLTISSGGFNLLSGSPSDCTTSTVLAAGASCQLRVNFAPASGGAQNATVTVSDNALNKGGSTQILTLTGTAVVNPAVITVQSGNAQTAAPLGTFALALKVLLTDSSGFAANNASVTFTAPTTGATGTFSNGTNTITVITAADGTASATLMAGGTRGTFTVTAAVPGVAATATFTETIAGNIAPVLTVSVPATAVTYGQTATLSATLTPSASGAVSAGGTISFFVNGGSTAVCTATVSSGAASCPYSPNAGANSVTATYSGDANFSSSQTASAKTYTVSQLAISGTTASISLPYGAAIPPITGTLTGVLSRDVGNVALSFMPNITKTPPDVGVYSLTAALTGTAAANYSVTVTGTPTLTITPAGTVTALTLSASQIFLGSSITFTANVASAVSGATAPAGTVTFTATSSTGTIYSFGPVSLVNGSASASTAGLASGNYSVTATYAGTSNNLSSTSSALPLIVQGPDFTVSVTPNALTLRQGDHGFVTVAVVGNQIFSGVTSFSCTGLPASMSCVFLPASVTGSASTVLTIATAGGTVAELRGTGSHVEFAMLALPGMVLLLFGASGRRRKRLNVACRLSALLLAVIAAASASGCGTGVNEPRTGLGTTNVTVSAQSGNITHTATVAVTVVSPNSIN